MSGLDEQDRKIRTLTGKISTKYNEVATCPVCNLFPILTFGYGSNRAFLDGDMNVTDCYRGPNIQGSSNDILPDEIAIFMSRKCNCLIKKGEKGFSILLELYTKLRNERYERNRRTTL